MMTLKVIEALLLLTTPPGTLEINNPSVFHADYAPVIRALAVQMEILDRQETKFILAKAEDFAADLKILQGRYQELAYAPYLEECDHFPSRDLVEDMLAAISPITRSWKPAWSWIKSTPMISGPPWMKPSISTISGKPCGKSAAI